MSDPDRSTRDRVPPLRPFRAQIGLVSGDEARPRPEKLRRLKIDAVVRLKLRRGAAAPAPCVVCRTDAVVGGCERCGAPLHEACYFDRVATAWDRAGFDALGDAEEESSLRRLIICPACRS